MDGKRIVITGATSGIGRAAAFALTKLGANLILVSRNTTEGLALVKHLSVSAPTAGFEFITADLSSPEEVREAANKISVQWNCVDVLINNAGARFDHYESTPEGYERTFATNHLGHFRLTGLLLDRLAKSPDARIINVTSIAAAHAKSGSPWQFDAVHYDRRQAYAKSKLANLLFTRELAGRFVGRLKCFAVDPGVVATRFARNNGLIAWLKHIISHARKRELRSARAGADTVVYLASNPHLAAEANGQCYRDRQPCVVCPSATDSESAAALWAVSVSLTGIDPCFNPRQIH
jgi:retinol dehydrogenase-12